MDFTYSGVLVEDIWPSGALWPHSQTRWQHRRRVDGAQRYRAALPTGETVYAFTREEMREAIGNAHALVPA